jgi:hypothetical protein
MEWPDLLAKLPRDKAGQVRPLEPSTLTNPAPGDIQRNRYGQLFKWTGSRWKYAPPRMPAVGETQLDCDGHVLVWTGRRWVAGDQRHIDAGNRAVAATWEASPTTNCTHAKKQAALT